MRRLLFGLRAATALVAAFAGVMVAAPAQAAAPDPIVAQRFAADSGDSCRYGYTEGYLSWRRAATSPTYAVWAVDVTGLLVDQPGAAVDIVCRDDRYYSFASFVAYSGSTVVDSHAERVDNGTVRLSFTLGNIAAWRGMDSLVVQVCRSPLVGTGYSYCGRAQTYRAPYVVA